MPLRRVLDLLRYWEEVPPLQELKAYQLGVYKPQASDETVDPGTPPMTEDEARAMIAQLNG